MRAVGFSPEAARYGGISVSRNYFLAMAISGSFAGLAGALDILGWQFRLSTSDIQTSTIGFTGIAVALLGRNTAVGVGFSALLFGALINGTSTRNLDPEIFQPELASNLTLLIQGLVVLFVGADVIVLTILEAETLAQIETADGRRRLPHERRRDAAPEGSARSARLPHGVRAISWVGILLGLVAAWIALPPLTVRTACRRSRSRRRDHARYRGRRIRRDVRYGIFAIVTGMLGITLAILAGLSGVDKLNSVVVWSALFAAMLRFATPLMFASLGGLFSERSGVVNIGLEGMMLMGAFFAILGADKTGSWVLGLLIGVLAGAALASVHAFFSISLRADQIVGGTAINFLALGSRATCSSTSTAPKARRPTPPASRAFTSPSWRGSRSSATSSGTST